MNKLHLIDSHTEGEPTRVVVRGAPDFLGGSMIAHRDRLQAEHDWIRTAIIHEPRGSDVMVGAVLCPPLDPDCVAGAIFFNNVGYLGMCGHAAMGVLVTLAHLDRIKPGIHALETPVGVVEGELHADGRVSIRNVASYRTQKDVSVSTARFGTVTGDIAWGGNWFFLVSKHDQEVCQDRIAELTDFCWQVREGLAQAGITGDDGKEIDHIELFGESDRAESINFVLCPGRAYDRSPCGTGTSAKVACLAADGKLAEGQVWRQASIAGGLFEAQYERCVEQIVPTVTGRAFVNAEVTVLINPDDPLRFGFPFRPAFQGKAGCE